MNELQIFENTEFGSVRTLMVNDDPYFVGKDVAEILGYQNGSRDINRHVDEEDRCKMMVFDGNQDKESIIINESGLYSLILSSKMPNAKKFKHWVTSEVLPVVRKHGGYLTPQKIEEVLLNPDTIIRLATDLKAEQEKRALLEAKVEQDKPKVIFADAVSASNSSMLVRDVAKMIRQNGVSMGEKRFYKWLREHGYICKGSTSPTQKAMELGLFETVIRTVERGDGLPIETKTTKITGKGQQYFINKFLQ